MKNFLQPYEIIYKKFCDLVKASGADESKISHSAFRRFMNISTGKGDAWRQGQWPSAEDLAAIAEKLGFSYRWLVTGEGDPEGADAPTVSVPQKENTPEQTIRIAALEAEVARMRELEEKVRLQQELLEAKDKIIALLTERQAEAQAVFSLKDTSAPTSPGAAPTARQDNK